MIDFLSVLWMFVSHLHNWCYSQHRETYKLHRTLSLVQRGDANLNVLKIILLLMSSSKNFIVNVCNLLSVNLEVFLMSGNLKYWLLSLVLLGSFHLMIFLLKYFLTDLSMNLGGYSLFVKWPSCFQDPSKNHLMCYSNRMFSQSGF